MSVYQFLSHGGGMRTPSGESQRSEARKESPRRLTWLLNFASREQLPPFPFPLEGVEVFEVVLWVGGGLLVVEPGKH